MAAVPNVRTVAEAAGVSPATVSNAYNRPGRLSAEVRARVFAVADEQGYTPDAAASSLRTGRAGAIGVIFTVGLSYAFSDPYYVDLLAGIAEVMEQTRTGLTLIPIEAPPANASEDEIRAAVWAVDRAVIDGAIADGLDDAHPAVRALARRGIPLVRSSDTGRGRCVFVDDHGAGLLVGRHLADLGHRDVVAIVANATPPPHVVREGVQDGELYPYSRLRLAGLRDGLGASARTRVVTAGRNSPEVGRAATAFALDSPAVCTAIAADSDVFALAAVDLLRERGLRPGDDVSVTGFDDIPAAAAAGLTTVRQPIREKGRSMGQMLLDPTFTAQRVVLPTQLVVRTSTGPCGDRLL
jgi:DNA-binding LacI/PurR family transcriptional regulator